MKEQKNLIIITFDQLRSDWFNTKEEIAELSSIVNLAENGLEYERCYCASPQCVPSRFSWISNLYPSQLGITKNEGIDIPDQVPSFIREMRNAGWATSLIGKTHWTSHRDQCDLRDKQYKIHNLGFEEVVEVAGPRALRHVRCKLTDEWEEKGLIDSYKEDLNKRYNGSSKSNAWEARESILPIDVYPDYWIAEKGKEMLEGRPTERPWVHWISFVGPHEPFDTPSKFHKYKRLPIRGRLTGNGKWIEKLDADNQLRMQYMDWKNKVSRHDRYQLRIDYTNKVGMLASFVGDIINTAKKRQDYERTAVVVTSDHGEMLGDFGMLYKSNLLEASIRVPFIYREPVTEKENTKDLIVNTTEPISLSEGLHTVAKGILENKTANKDIYAKLKDKKYVICEYGNEFAIIHKKIKIIFDDRGNPVWLSKFNNRIGKEKGIRIDKINIRHSSNKIVRKIIRYGKKEWRKRNHPDWIFKVR